MEYTTNDFKKGNKVYHLSEQQFTTRQEMIVIYVGLYDIRCSWMSKDGLSQRDNFYPFELKKIN